MKTISKFFVLSAFMLALTVVACNPGNNNSDDTKDKTGKEYTSKYVCPMHCEGSGSNEPGICSVCGMDYVENKNYKEEGHDAMDHHDGDMHEHMDEHMDEHMEHGGMMEPDSSATNAGDTAS